MTGERTIAEGRTASYRMESLDAEAEFRRLRIQVELVRHLEDEFLAHTGLSKDAVFLDVGCGPGFFAERVAQELLGPSGRVVGVDVDAALIRAGKQRLGDGRRVELRVGTAVRLPLDDDSVDFAYARFLFQHLAEPRVVLAEMVRVTRPGGIVAITDTDDGGLVVFPEPEGLSDLLAASFEAQASRGGDRHVGRKLRAMVSGAGLDDPRIWVRPLTTEEIAPEHFVAITLGFKAGVIGPPHMSKERARAIQSALQDQATQPGFFGHALGYGAWGRVPVS